ncbi:MAG: DUF3382 domain-containing protein, partial [Magnetococcus sp. DMHC-8]
MPGALLAALRVALVALLLFVPVTGLVLSGYQLELHWQRPLWLAGAVFVGHLLLAPLWGRFQSAAAAVAHHQRGASTTQPGSRRFWIGLALLIAL